MKIRVARPDDLHPLLEVEHSCFEEPNTNLLARVCGSIDLLYVAEDDGVLGYILCAPEDSEKARVVSLAVHPEHEGNGIGTRLMKYSLRELEAREFSTVALEVRFSNRRAMSLYGRLGFEIVGVKEGYYEDGEDAYVMKKSL